MKSSKPMSRAQAYHFHTDRIRQWLNHGVGVLPDILAVKRGELWKEKWSSWNEYCEKEFGKTARRAYQLLEIASTIDEIQSVKPFHTESGKNKGILAENVSHEKCPASESFTVKNKAILENLNSRQAAALKGLPPVKKAEVFSRAIQEQGGKSPKATTINNVRQKVEAAPKAVLDELGRVIPEECLALWEQRHEADSLAKELSRLKCFFERAHNEGHPLFRQMNCQEAFIKLESVRYCVVQSKPYVVCRHCQGHPFAQHERGCAVCAGTGLIGKDRFNNLPEELKNFPVRA